MFLEIKDVEKYYESGTTHTQVLNKVSVSIENGERCVILGPSGSGKSTLLNVIGGLDQVDSGTITIENKEISKLKSKELSLYRRDYVGFIFQFYNLIPNLTVRENIQVLEFLANNPLNIEELLDTLGLAEHKNKFPSQLSGGQQQRCAIARALVKNPKLLLCDEPTGALDYSTSIEMLILMEQINEKFGTTMLIVTHNTAIKDMVHKVIKIKDGRVVEDYRNDTLIPAKNLEW
ncbi:ABC transporter ATP-binding protein [Paenibacillus typhae]|uniref:Putative ABC transport system ATP-binding protein n=1 Tax=Paenibacillus typhae TaxID=1174501 RepID=A0A1G8F7U9_9BACL|nr:ABC transporter ATP-binding protein [Paenibacillus typhae]SDH78226.1 putative ABC transport system ATP-binding protein [Paenibacillus typhae]